MDTPESHYFRRSPQQGVFSPVIPFYWGFREEDAKIQKHTKHGQWLDQ